MNLARTNPIVFALALICLLAASRGPTVSGGESSPAPEPNRDAKVRILVAYYSLTGNTAAMAEGVAQGARAVPGTTVVVKRVEEINKQDLIDADAIALGCPTYFANIPGKMKLLIDDWNWKWKVDFTDKVGGAFTTGGGQVGGKEHVVVSLLLFMINNRMVVAGPLYQDAEGDDIWGEAGAAAMTGPLDPGVGDHEIDGAVRLGDRLARLAGRLRP